MKFVHGSMHRALLPVFVLLAASCGGEGEDYSNGPARRRDWKTSSDLVTARRSNPTDVMMQVRLHGLGYNPGPINGVVGFQTKTALRRFQMDHGLLASGLPGPATRACLLPASIRLAGGYPTGGTRRRSLGSLFLGPRYPGDIAPFVGADDGYGLTPMNGTRENFYRILRSENRRESTSKH